MARRNSADDLALESRRCTIAELYLKGIKRQRELAEQVKVDQKTISRDLAVIRQRWRESAVQDWNEAVGEELDRLSQIEREAWEAWQKSRQAKETTTDETITDQDGEVTTGADGTPIAYTTETTKHTLKVEDLYGDPRFLLIIQNCVKERCKILGLYAPEKREENRRVAVTITVEQLAQAQREVEDWRRERFHRPPIPN